MPVEREHEIVAQLRILSYSVVTYAAMPSKNGKGVRIEVDPTDKMASTSDVYATKRTTRRTFPRHTATHAPMGRRVTRKLDVYYKRNRTTTKLQD